MKITDAPWDARHRWARAVGIACDVKRRNELAIPLLSQPTLDVRHSEQDTRFATPGASYVYLPDVDELHELVGPLNGTFVATVFGGDGAIRYSFVVAGHRAFFGALGTSPPEGVEPRWN